MKPGQTAASEEAAAGSASAEPTEPSGTHAAEGLITGRDGRWVTTPSGERIFLLDETPSSQTPRPLQSPPQSVPKPPSAASPEIDHEARSEEMQEIISYVPSWLVRWGITAIFASLLCLLLIAWMVRYPEVVHSTASVTTPSPPVRLVAHLGGELERLFVRDGEHVAAGAMLAVFRSTASYRDVLALAERLPALRESLAASEFANWHAPPAAMSLGGLEVPYSDLFQELAEYRSFRADSFFTEMAAALDRQITDQQRLRASQEKRESLLAAELRLAERQCARNQQLAAGGLLSERDYELGDAECLRKRQAIETARGDLVLTDVRITQIQSTLIETRQRHDERERTLRLSVRSAYHALRAAMDAWLQDYVILAPLDGSVSFFRNLTEGQFVAAHQPLLAVLPPGDDPIATIFLEPAGAGRVQPGQRVILRLDSFPATEFGTVEGRVESISMLMNQPASEGSTPSYLVRVALPRGLETSYGKRLEFRQEMGGTADIVTEDLSLLERLFQQLRSVITSTRGPRSSQEAPDAESLRTGKLGES